MVCVTLGGVLLTEEIVTLWRGEEGFSVEMWDREVLKKWISLSVEETMAGELMKDITALLVVSALIALVSFVLSCTN